VTLPPDDFYEDDEPVEVVIAAFDAAKAEGMGRRVKVTGAEQDMFTGWRRWYCYLNNHNKARRSIKRGAHKRERRAWKKGL